MTTTKARGTSGATFALVAACLVILAIIGIGFAFMSLQIGGKRQTEHAAENGSLSLMQAVCKISVPYTSLSVAQQSIVKGAFQDKPPAGIDLINYNQLIGYAMVQAQNSIDHSGGANGQEYASAQQIIDAIQNDSDSIGQQLITAINKKLADSTFVETNFTSVANANPMGLGGMFGRSSQVKLLSCTPQYINQYGSTDAPISNVSLDLNNPAYKDLAAWAKGGPDKSQLNADKLAYTFVSGYTAIDPKIAAGSGGTSASPYKALYAISINPNEPVHLVADAAITTPKGNPTSMSGGKTPPFNGLKIVAYAAGSDGTHNNQTSVFVVAGGETTVESAILPPSIPGGYIVIKNEKPIDYPGTVDIVNVASAAENNELMAGVYVTSTAKGYPLFTTAAADSATGGLNAWAAYNFAVGKGLPATKPQLNSSEPIFNPGGAIATEAELLSIKYANLKTLQLGVANTNGKLCSECFWNSFEGKTAQKACQNLRGSFIAAYGVPNTVSSFQAPHIVSVEAAKAAFIDAYGYRTQHFSEMLAKQQQQQAISTIFINIRKAEKYGGNPGDMGEDAWITTTTTTDFWSKAGTALTLAATGNVGECINNIGNSEDNDVMVGISGLQKFPHVVPLYASSADGSGDFLPFMSTIAAAPKNAASIKSVKVSQDGTLLDYMSEIATYMTVPANGPVKKLIYPLVSDYPFCSISLAGAVKAAKPPMTREVFIKNLKTQMTAKKGVVGTFIKAMHQIVPNKNLDQFGSEVYDILTGQTIPMGQTLYIYADQNNKDAQGLPKLILTKNSPNGNANPTPNGTTQVFKSSYAVLGKTVNPPKEMAITDSLFTQMVKGIAGTGSKTKGLIKGVDQAVWTPNTGTNNLLGELDFSSGLSGLTESDFNFALSLTSQTTTRTVVTCPN